LERDALTKSEFHHRRIDVQALSGSGVVVIEASRLKTCRHWLKAMGYTRLTLDCSQDLEAVFSDFGKLMNWEKRFGYAYETGGKGGDALHDGFQIRVPRKGLVFELYRADLLWEHAPRWIEDFLWVVSKHSHHHLTLGRHFFCLLTVADQPLENPSPLLNASFQTHTLGLPYRDLFHDEDVPLSECVIAAKRDESQQCHPR
jgi:hypothetical protein